FVEYTGAVFLFGVPLFLEYSPPARVPPARFSNGLVILAAAALAVTAPAHFLAQTAELSGSAAPDAATLKASFVELDFGKSCLVRGVAAVLALAANIIPLDDAWRRRLQIGLGAMVCASFAWMGHGAATEGAGHWLHLGTDILHVLAASAWIGALAVFALWLLQPGDDDEARLARLRGFSGFGILLVCILLATGIANTLFVIGPARLPMLWQSRYGQVLTAKIILFMGMLCLAARNRAIARTPGASAARIYNSLLLEMGLGMVVLALVAWLGTLQPA
ncbi:MAG TPA: copper homeostasis membrane protein CopD, partial [Rhizomicrobium sp.]|nr:copper homeostasis membrane protein CopD [Rhizomicrobium sp.]